MQPKILQSLISINRNSIRMYEEGIEYNKALRDNDRMLGCSEDANEAHKLVVAHKKHLALLVRNQIALKKALREAYEDLSWNNEYSDIDYA